MLIPLLVSQAAVVAPPVVVGTGTGVGGGPRLIHPMRELRVAWAPLEERLAKVMREITPPKRRARVAPKRRPRHLVALPPAPARPAAPRVALRLARAKLLAAPAHVAAEARSWQWVHARARISAAPPEIRALMLRGAVAECIASAPSQVATARATNQGRIDLERENEELEMILLAGLWKRLAS